MTDQTLRRIEIQPKPTDEEAAAIAAVVLAISARDAKPEETRPPLDRWREAGKVEALRGDGTVNSAGEWRKPW